MIILKPKNEINIYNAAAFRLNNIIFLIPRVLDKDHISRFTLAYSKDCKKFNRLDYPIMFPKEKFETPTKATLKKARERGGIEDPRATIVKDRLYLVYTAYSSKCHIAIASIKIKDFKTLFKKSLKSKKDLSNEWNNSFKRHGLVFPKEKGFSRNACLTQIKNKFALIYRKDYGNAFISFSKKPAGPFKHKNISFISKDFDWEQNRVGISTPAIKLGNLYLYLYHGVEEKKFYNCNKVYHIGALIAKFGKKSFSITKLTKPIISPTKKDIIKGSWLWPVKVAAIFTCGAVRLKGNKVLVVYSASDHDLRTRIINPFKLFKGKLLKHEIKI